MSDANLFTSGCLGKQGALPFPGEQEGLPAVSAFGS